MSDNTTQTISSLQPNLRFGTSFLDTKYRDRAAFGESLMDKRTGEVVLKRKEDGSLLYFNREAPKIDDFIMQITSLIKSNVGFNYPSSNNRENINNIQFMTTLTDLQDFEKEFANIEQGYSYGVKFINNSEESMSMAKEMNGFFLKLVSRPRDSAIIEFLSYIHNGYISSYSGDDPEILEMKNLYETNESYRNATVEIEYTVKGYDSNMVVRKEITKKAYLPLNQMVLVSFFDDFINQNEYSFLALRINSVRLPKIKYALDFVNDSQYHETYASLVDNVDSNIALTHMYISTFVEMNSNTKIANEINSRVISSISLSSFEKAVETLNNISSAGGIHVSADIPDDLTLSRIEVWAERLREVKNKGETENVLDEPITSMEELEYLFGEIENIRSYLTTDSSLLDGMFVGLQSISGIFSPPSLATIQNELPW